MSNWQGLILACILLPFLLGQLTEFLNRRHVSPELPEEFKDEYDEEKYRLSQRYVVDSSLLGVSRSVFGLAVRLLFVFGGGYALLDGLAGGAAESALGQAVVFFLVLMLIQQLLALPFSWYGTFVLEERYGFNRSSVGTFVADQVKGLVISLVLGLLLLSLVVVLFQVAGNVAWLWAWLATAVVLVVLQVLAPAVLLPLFNKFEPLPEGELRTELEAYARKENFKLRGLYRIDGSRRSSRGNAYFTGLGRWKRIALFDTLIEKHPARELLAILAHEMGHFKLKHVQKSMLTMLLGLGAAFWLFSLLLDQSAIAVAAGFERPSFQAALVAFGLLMAPLSLLSRVLQHWMSRKNEFAADDYAARTTGEPELLVAGLKRLTIENLGNLSPHPLKVLLEYSHPPVTERIRVLRARRSASHAGS